MSKKIIIKGLEDIDITKNGNWLFADINLNYIQYTHNNVDILIDKLTRLKNNGFVNFQTSYNIGYYDSVEDISLEFIKQLK